jgi:hypothetical protein
MPSDATAVITFFAMFFTVFFAVLAASKASGHNNLAMADVFVAATTMLADLGDSGVH